MSPGELPQFDSPPVNEIVGAAQFIALPKFGLSEIVKVGHALEGFELRELQPQLPPIQEGPPGQPEPPQFPQFFFGVGGAQHAQRALYFRGDDRFVAQLQRDRIAINERRTPADDSDPSSEHVGPMLEKFSEIVQATLVESDGYGPNRTTLVELTYVNTIVPAPGAWADHKDLHRVLRIVSSIAGDAPYARPERAVVQFSFPLGATDTFLGRLHVAVNPGYSADGTPVFNLNLVSRRLVDPPSSMATVFDACHREAVNAFAAITTPRMHTIWGRTR